MTGFSTRDLGEKAATSLSINKHLSHNFSVDHQREERKTCHICKEEGHISRDCSKRTPKQRKKPTTKKFWCALHKDNSSRSCFSNACQELRKLPPEKRVKLMQENSDCFHCCGDHKPDDCPKKDRVCGNGKENRGC